MDLGRCFKDAWNLLMKDLAPLAATAAIGAVVIVVVTVLVGLGAGTSLTAAVSGGELKIEEVGAGAVVFGAIVIAVVGIVVGAWECSTLLKIMLRRVREMRAASMSDLRLGLEGIGRFILAMLVLEVVIGLGFVALVIPGLILMTIWAYALVLVADRDSGIGEAMSGSMALAKKPGYLMTFVTLLLGGIVVGAVGGLLGMIPIIGQILGIFTGVYGIAYLVAMYFQATGETALLDHALYGVPLPVGPTAGAASPPAPGAAYTPAPPAAAGEAPVTSSADVWATAAEPLGAAAVPAPPIPPTPPAPAAAPAPPAPPSEPPTMSPSAPSYEPPSTSVSPPVVSEVSGTLTLRCSQCGAAVGASDTFCHVCGFELSGGHGTSGDTHGGEGDEARPA